MFFLKCFTVSLVQSAQSKAKGQIKANLPEPVVFHNLMVDRQLQSGLYVLYDYAHYLGMCRNCEVIVVFLNKDDPYFM